MFKLDLENAEEPEIKLPTCIGKERKFQKKHLNDPDNHDGVITHLEPYILECEVKWALGSITRTKLVEVMEFQ